MSACLGLCMSYAHTHSIRSNEYLKHREETLFLFFLLFLNIIIIVVSVMYYMHAIS